VPSPYGAALVTPWRSLRLELFDFTLVLLMASV
jgi:hypothetical protein